MIKREGQIIMILFRQWRTGNHHIRQIDAFAAAQRTTHLDDGGKAVTVDCGNPQYQLAIIDQQPRARFQRREYIGMREPDTVGVTRISRIVKDETVADGQHHPLDHFANTVLWSLKISQNTGWPADCRLKIPDGADSRGMLGL